VKKLSQSYDQIYKNTCKKNKVFVYLMMQHIQGISRHQLQVVSLEDTIYQDNPVRFIDAFVHRMRQRGVLMAGNPVPFNTGFIVRLAAATNP
jgi:putative N-acetylmannosamine-6-phosphate epimerase